MAEAGARLARELGATAEALSIPDSANIARTLIEIAEERDARAIVVGSRGLGGIKARVLGSTSRKLLHDTHLPVLVVRTPEYSAARAPKRPWPAPARSSPWGDARRGAGRERPGVPEGLSAAEVGKEIAEHKKHAAAHETRPADRWLSIVEAVLLSLVAVLAAYSGYAAAKWSTESSVTLAKASAERTKASRAVSRGS